MSNHAEKIRWMEAWAGHAGVILNLEGECGFGRECVGIVGPNGSYPDYEWHDQDYNRTDPNGDVWTPPDAYHKHPCVAVLGRGEEAEDQLYQWLRWFEDNGFVFEDAKAEHVEEPPLIAVLLGRTRTSRMVKKQEAAVKRNTGEQEP